MVRRSCESAFDRELAPPQKKFFLNSALKSGPAKTGPAGPRATPMTVCPVLDGTLRSRRAGGANVMNSYEK